MRPEFYLQCRQTRFACGLLYVSDRRELTVPLFFSRKSVIISRFAGNQTRKGVITNNAPRAGPELNLFWLACIIIDDARVYHDNPLTCSRGRVWGVCRP